MYVQSLSCVRLFVIPWTVACQAPLSMGFSKQKYWSGLPFPPPGDLPNPGTEPKSPAAPALQVASLPLNHWVVCACHHPTKSTYFHIPHSAANNDLNFKRDLVYEMDNFENKISLRRLCGLKCLSLLDM